MFGAPSRSSSLLADSVPPTEKSDVCERSMGRLSAGPPLGETPAQSCAIISGLAAIHQFCRIGKMSMVGGCSKVVQDVPPYMMADGNPAETRTINKVGMERNGVSAKAQSALKHAYKILFRTKLGLNEALSKLRAEHGGHSEIDVLLDFVEGSQRGITR